MQMAAPDIGKKKGVKVSSAGIVLLGYPAGQLHIGQGEGNRSDVDQAPIHVPMREKPVSPDASTERCNNYRDVVRWWWPDLCKASVVCTLKKSSDHARQHAALPSRAKGPRK